MALSSNYREKENSNINFNEKQLLRSDNVIVLTTGEFDHKAFSGVVVWIKYSCSDFEIGHFSSTWIPAHFEKFTGEITIKTD